MDKYRNLEEGQADVINCPLGLECPEIECRNWRECCYAADDIFASRGLPYIYLHLINCLEVVESVNGFCKAMPIPYAYYVHDNTLEVLYSDYCDYGWEQADRLPYEYDSDENVIEVLRNIEKSAREYGFAPALDLLSANYHRKRLSQPDFDSSEPEEFCQYLIDLGWKKFIPTQRVLADLVSSGRAVTFKKAKNGTDRHILFPLDRQAPDYDSRMYDVLKVLSAVEGKPARDLVYMRLNSLQKFYEHSAIQRSLGN